MRWGLTAAAVFASIGLGLVPNDARAHHDEVRLVRSWYHRYLHRPADRHGLHCWVNKLESGVAPELVQAGILASEEYYCAHGHSAEGFVTGLYNDVLGRQPYHREVCHWVAQLHRVGCRERLANDFLCAARPELAVEAGAWVPVVVERPQVYPAAYPVQGIRVQVRASR